MIVRLLLLIVLPILAWYSVKSISQKYSLTARQNRYLFLTTAALLLIVLLIMLGRLPVQWLLAPLGAAGAFLLRMLPAALRLLPFWQMLGSRISTASASASQNQTSTLRTEYLEMALVHGSGELDGNILRGEFAGRRLSSLGREELLRLHAECRADADSRQVLEAYLERSHSGWRNDAHQGEESPDDGAANAEITMNRQLAFEILGLNEGASREDIIRVHRKLMQKFHPDRGGSDYFSKKINAAKDLLLNSESR